MCKAAQGDTIILTEGLGHALENLKSNTSTGLPQTHGQDGLDEIKRQESY